MKTKNIFLTAVLIAVSFTTFAQVGIGTTSPAASAALDVTATDKAVLLPRVANTAAIATPVDGMIVYDISTKCVRTYEKNNWTTCLSPVTAAQAAATILAQIGAEGDNPDTENSVVTADQLNLLGLSNVVAANITAYQDYIDANPDNFSNPATNTEVQNMVNAVNVAAIVAASNDPADGTPSIADLAAVGVTGLVTANVVAYEAAVALADPKPTTLAQLQTIVDEVNTFVTANAADIVISPTGKIWANKNLGASQVATSSTDAASYGNHYQWGKAQAFTSAYSTANNVAGPVASAAVAGTKFVTNGTAPYDWITPANDFLWNSGTVSNPTKTAQDPCPTNYRVPTETELNNERLAFSSNNSAGAYASTLKLPVAGYRNSSIGALASVGSLGYYWSRTVSGTNARYLYFNSSTAYMYSGNRAVGFSVRCIKE